MTPEQLAALLIIIADQRIEIESLRHMLREQQQSSDNGQAPATKEPAPAP